MDVWCKIPCGVVGPYTGAIYRDPNVEWITNLGANNVAGIEVLLGTAHWDQKPWFDAEQQAEVEFYINALNTHGVKTGLVGASFVDHEAGDANVVLDQIKWIKDAPGADTAIDHIIFGAHYDKNAVVPTTWPPLTYDVFDDVQGGSPAQREAWIDEIKLAFPDYPILARGYSYWMPELFPNKPWNGGVAGDMSPVASRPTGTDPEMWELPLISNVVSGLRSQHLVLEPQWWEQDMGRAIQNAWENQATFWALTQAPPIVSIRIRIGTAVYLVEHALRYLRDLGVSRTYVMCLDDQNIPQPFPPSAMAAIKNYDI